MVTKRLCVPNYFKICLVVFNNQIFSCLPYICIKVTKFYMKCNSSNNNEKGPYKNHSCKAGGILSSCLEGDTI